MSKTPDELDGVDFAYYGDRASFLHLRDIFSRESAITFIADKKRRRKRLKSIKRGPGELGQFAGLHILFRPIMIRCL